MNGEQTFNVNSAECLKSESNFTETIVHNICNNTESVIPHGSLDMTLAFLFIAFLAIIVVSLIGFILSIIFD